MNRRCSPTTGSWSSCRWCRTARGLGTVYLRVITESFERRLVRYAAIMLLATMAALVLAVLGAAQRALARANAELEQRARDLADANAKLQAEMEEREKAEERAAPEPEDGGDRPALRRHRARLQQSPHHHQGQSAAACSAACSRAAAMSQRYIAPAMEGLARAASLTQRILAFSRRQPLSPQPVNLSQLIAEMGELLKHSVGETVTVDTRLERRLVDPVRRQPDGKRDPQSRHQRARCHARRAARLSIETDRYARRHAGWPPTVWRRATMYA